MSAVQDDMFESVEPDVAWLYEAAPPTRKSAAATTEAPAGRLSVARWVVVTQGLLLILVGVSAYLIGTMTRSATTSSEPSLVDRPCTVSGTVRYGTSGGTMFPDEGAVVLFVPAGERPANDEKVAFEGLRPDDLPLAPQSESVQRLRLLGGGHARTDTNGEYRVTLPRGGKFYVLVLSHHGKRAENVLPNRSDLAQLGRYVTSAADLIGEQRYRWRLEDVTRDRRLDEALP